MKYDDIINLPHFEPKKHYRMSMENRSAQFAPFSALTGYSEKLRESEIELQERIVLFDSEKEVINQKLQNIKDNLANDNTCFITYYFDKEKQYITKNVTIKKIDLVQRIIKLQDNNKINIDDILDIEI